MSVSRKLMGTTKAGGGQIDISDYFSTYLYTGNGSTQTITNGIDLATEGGLVWNKPRSGTYATDDHALSDTERGVNKILRSNTTSAEAAGSVQVYNSDGFTLGSATGNLPSTNYASWTFRKAPRFFDVVTYTGDGVAGREIAHGLNNEVGMLVVKRTDGTNNSWYVFHRDIDATAPENYILLLNDTLAKTSASVIWNNTAPTTSTFTVGNNDNVNGNGFTYVAYLYAHDPLGPSEDGSDGLIACGSYTGNGSATGPVVDLGWEPQWLLVKRSDSTGDWNLIDNMRGFTAGGADAELNPNLSAAESTGTFVSPTATGFQPNTTDAGYNASGGTYVYIAIRRGPMRVPESGTEVFNDTFSYNEDTEINAYLGAPADALIQGYRLGGISAFPTLRSRLTGGNRLTTSSTAAEVADSTSFWDNMLGFDDAASPAGSPSTNVVQYVFRRAPNFFDVVAYTGDGVAGRTVPHNLGVAPEMMIVKTRNDVTNWRVYHKDLAASGQFINLDVSLAAISSTNVWGDGTTFISPTDSLFTVGSGQGVNDSAKNLIWYGFATLAGISKVGSYTGNGTSQTINCGFTTGARLVLIKATSTTGDWLIADTARGIVAGNDPYLELNTTNAEVTSEDWLDPDSSGFVVNEVAGSNANTSGVSYIFYAVA